MLRRLPTAVAVLATFVHFSANAAFAYSYMQAESLIFFQRDPFATQATLDSDYRLQAMGGLDLPISDESNKVGTFKYGQAPAGLAQDYSENKVELGITGEGGTVQDKEHNNTTYTGDIADYGQSSLHGMVALRTGHTPENHGVFAAGLIGEADQIDYDSNFKNFGGYRSVEDKPGVGQLRFGYGHQLGKILFGLGIDSVDAKLRDETGTLTSGAANNIEITRGIVDVVPSVGYVAPLQQGAFTFTLSPRFRSSEDTLKINGAERKYEKDGTLVDLGAHYGNGEALQSAFYVTVGGVDGDVTQSGAAAGTAETDTTDIRFRLNARPQASKLSFGLLLERLKDTIGEKNNNGVKIHDDEIVDNTLGGGIAYHFAEDKGLVGIELRLLKIETTDNLLSDNNEKSTGYEVRLGGERIVGSKLWLRAGLNVKSLDETPQDEPTLNATSAQLALGAEYFFNPRASLALNLSSVGISTEGSSSAFVDKEEYAGASFQLVGKIHFGETAVQ